MKVDPQYLKYFKDALRQESLRFTSQRLAILEDIIQNEDHRECDDIHQSLKSRNVSVSRATIYRTLDLLEKVGIIRKMNIGDGRFRYENQLSRSHHDHLICVRCGKIIEFIDQEVEHRQERIAAKYGFDLEDHTHQLFGVCTECQSNKVEPVDASK